MSMKGRFLLSNPRCPPPYDELNHDENPEKDTIKAQKLLEPTASDTSAEVTTQLYPDLNDFESHIPSAQRADVDVVDESVQKSAAMASETSTTSAKCTHCSGQHLPGENGYKAIQEKYNKKRRKYGKG